MALTAWLAVSNCLFCGERCVSINGILICRKSVQYRGSALILSGKLRVRMMAVLRYGGVKTSDDIAAEVYGDEWNWPMNYYGSLSWAMFNLRKDLRHLGLIIHTEGQRRYELRTSSNDAVSKRLPDLHNRGTKEWDLPGSWYNLKMRCMGWRYSSPPRRKPARPVREQEAQHPAPTVSPLRRVRSYGAESNPATRRIRIA